nr:MAG TPA: hypothetical protein [Caudoviricetes sp.]
MKHTQPVLHARLVWATVELSTIQVVDVWKSYREAEKQLIENNTESR